MLYGIDIFSGAGGLSLGAEMAGIKIAHAIEINESAAKTFKKNHKGAEIHQTEIKNVKPFDNNYEAKATATITPPTGEDRQEMIVYLISGIMALAILSTGIVMIKKIVNQ